jgi:hypothetical protein
MPYTAQTLVTRSWYLSGIVARNLQTPTGDQINNGLALLNALLDWKTIETDLIPYWTYNQSVVCVPGQETYFIPNCVAIESVTFVLQSVRYAMDFTSRRTYFGSGRVNNITTLPFNWNFNLSVGGGTLYLYFIPDQNYPLQIMGKFALTDVALDTDMLTVYDSAYMEYLRYALAKYMCNEYGIGFSPDNEKQLIKMARTLMYVSPPDLSIIKTSILTQGSGLNFGDVNIGKGYRPN